jgi:hypothetical protein
VEVDKGPGKMVLTGRGYPSGQIDVSVAGRGLQIEDFQTITDKGVGLTGLMSFDMGLKGPVFKPALQFTGQTSHVLMGTQSLADSKAEFHVNQSSVEGKAEFIGDRIRAEFAFPLEDNRPFKLAIATQKWDFAPLFNLISPNIKQQNYETELTSSITLEAATGGFRKSSGSIDVETFKVRRNNLQMQNSEPIQVRVNAGGIDVKKF